MAEPENSLDPAVSGNADSVPPVQENGAAQIPERFQGKSMEEVAQAYSELEQMHGRQMNDLAPVIQLNKELEPYGGVRGLWDAYNTVFTNYQQLLQGQQPQGQQPQGQQSQGQSQGQRPPASSSGQTASNDWPQDWDYMTPREQHEYMRQSLRGDLQQGGQQLYEQALNQLTEAINQQLGTMRQEWDIYRGVRDIQQSNPNLNPEEVMQEALGIAQSKPQELLQLAAQALANKDGKAVDHLAQQKFERYKADFEQEQRNQQLNAILPGGQTLQDQFSRGNDAERPRTEADIHREVARKLLDDPNSGFRPEHFSA